MAKDLFEETRFLIKGDFSQEDIIKDNILLGKNLPTTGSIFQSYEDQVIFLELWNETEKQIDCFVKTKDKIVMNNKICVCDEEKYAHTFHQLNLKKGEEIFASASEDNSISYNIIL